MPTTFKNPNELAKSFTSNDEMYRSQLKDLNIPENEWDSYLENIQNERQIADFLRKYYS